MLTTMCSVFRCVLTLGLAFALAVAPAWLSLANVEAREIVVVTWNIRGYPEDNEAKAQYIDQILSLLAPDILCVQEINDGDATRRFQESEPAFTGIAFHDTPSDGRDNAILTRGSVSMLDLPDPQGFDHRPQVAYVWSGQFDAVVINVHFSAGDTPSGRGARKNEGALLGILVREMLETDPDVIVVGDFNMEEVDVKRLADEIGMTLLLPLMGVAAKTTAGDGGHAYDYLMISQDLIGEEAPLFCEVSGSGDGGLCTIRPPLDHCPVDARFRTDGGFRDRP